MKIYFLSCENVWQEYAIGNLQLVNEEELGCVFLRVIEKFHFQNTVPLRFVTHRERNHSGHAWSMNLQVSSEIVYSPQSDSIITWFQPDI